MFSDQDLIVIAVVIAGVLLITVITLIFTSCRQKSTRSNDTISDFYQDARIYAAQQYHIPHIPRVVPPSDRQRRRRRREVVLDVDTIVLALPPPYAHVIEHSQDFPHPDPLELEIPPPTYQEVIRMLGMGHSIQHI